MHYDAFVSYARSDDKVSGTWVLNLVQNVQQQFRTATGRKLRLFLDVQEVEASDQLPARLEEALENSSIMVAVCSLRYFLSKWCCREWDHFTDREARLRKRGELHRADGLIIPIELEDLVPTNLSREAKARVRLAKNKHAIDFRGANPDGAEFKQLSRDLAGQIQRCLDRSQARYGRGGVDGLSVRIGTNQEQFLDRLSQAERVVLLGLTHQHLCHFLQEALLRKRAKDSRAFWQSLEIVFPSDVVLKSVLDELTVKSAQPESAVEERRLRAGAAKREITNFLTREDESQRWQLYEYAYVLPFLGAWFELSDGQRIAQIATLRPGYSTSQHLFVEFTSPGMAAETGYYEMAFGEVLRNSTKQNEVVFVGRPQHTARSGFVVTSAQFRRSILHGPPAEKTEWIPAILALLWQERTGRALPLLHIRTPSVAVRELHTLSNISGYVSLEDCPTDLQSLREFPLPPSVFRRAVERELREELETNEPHWDEPQLVNQSRFYDSKHECLYFSIWRVKVEMPAETFGQNAGFRAWSFQNLLRVREYQVLAKAKEILRMKPKHRQQMDVAVDVLSDNLVLHRQLGLAGRLRQALRENRDCSKLRAAISKRMAKKRLTYNDHGKRHVVEGLAGLQYREFFRLLVPAYAEIGVIGASTYQRWLRKPQQAAALARLSQHYSSPESIHDAGMDV